MKTKYQKIKAVQNTVCIGTGIVVGVVACIGIVGVATTLTGRIIGGAFAFTGAAGLSTTAAQNVSDPIVELYNTESND